MLKSVSFGNVKKRNNCEVFVAEVRFGLVTLSMLAISDIHCLVLQPTLKKFEFWILLSAIFTHVTSQYNNKFDTASSVRYQRRTHVGI